MNYLSHPSFKRIVQLDISSSTWQDFQNQTAQFNQVCLEKRPYTRLVLADVLTNTFGIAWVKTLQETIINPNKAALIINHPNHDFGQTLRFSTAIAHLLGHAEFDQMTGKYYASVDLAPSPAGDSYLTEPYHDLRLHTDGTFYNKPIDWIVLGKTKQRGVKGGELTLHHLYDIEDLDELTGRNEGWENYEFKASASKNVQGSISKPILFHHNDELGIRFSDQFCHPSSIKQALFLHELSEKLENSPNRILHPFTEGTLLILNNLFWLHGRLKLEQTPTFERQLLRLRGAFYQQESSMVA